MSEIQKKLEKRFYRYLAIPSQSDASQSVVPSSNGQWDMVRLLAKELELLGLEEVFIDQNGVLTALKKGTIVSKKTIGFVAHVDTVDVGLSDQIKPQTLVYTGADLCLNQAQNIWFRREEHPEAERYINESIIFSDGTSVLGADNKAAVTCIMELLQELSDNRTETGDIYVAFVPDEEIGLRGAKVLDLSRFKADFAYTIDCCEEGELVYETFNAGSVEVNFYGVTAHPMSAKNILVNPLLMANDFISLFNRKETPECTDGREGYFYCTSMVANANSATLNMSIRDFDRHSYETRKSVVWEHIERIKQQYPKGIITCEIEDVYSNIKEAMDDRTEGLDLLYKSFEQNSIIPKVIPMRGGTDGSALSKRGLFTPNYFTGALNFHSKFEFLPLSAFEKSFNVTKSLCLL